jgi:hypothetical protein
MESSAYTDRTLDLHEELWDAGYRNVGVVLQAYLHRTPDDVKAAIARGDRAGALERLKAIDGHYGGLAAPRIVELNARFRALK